MRQNTRFLVSEVSSVVDIRQLSRTVGLSYWRYEARLSAWHAACVYIRCSQCTGGPPFRDALLFAHRKPAKPGLAMCGEHGQEARDQEVLLRSFVCCPLHKLVADSKTGCCRGMGLHKPYRKFWASAEADDAGHHLVLAPACDAVLLPLAHCVYGCFTVLPVRTGSRQAAPATSGAG